MRIFSPKPHGGTTLKKLGRILVCFSRSGAMTGGSRFLLLASLCASLFVVTFAEAHPLFVSTPGLRAPHHARAAVDVKSLYRVPASSSREGSHPLQLFMRRKSKSDIPIERVGNIFKEVHNVDKGCVLVASADEVDHFFRKGVTLVLDHGDRGSRGLLLEMKTAFTIGEMAPSLKGTALADNPLFRGGDSGEDKVLMIHGYPSLEGAVPIGETGICVGGIKAAVQKVEEGELPAEHFKFVFNQVEWTSGQLERELSQGLWRAGIAVPELLTRQVAAQSERDQLFGGVKFDADRSLWDILTFEMGDEKLEAREVQYSRGRTPAQHIVETKKLLLKMMVERVFEFRNKRDANSIVALLDGGAEVFGKRGNDAIAKALEASWADPFWQAEVDKESVTVDDTGLVSYSFRQSTAETAAGKAEAEVVKGQALLSESGLIQTIEEPAP